MRKLGYLVVEGPHDVEFACRLIKSKVQVERMRLLNDLDPTLQELVPDKFPHGGDLQKRVPVPIFLQNDNFAIAVHAAGGDSRIADCLLGTFDVLDANDFAGVGVILDSDSTKSPGERHTAFLALAKDAPISFAPTPGLVHLGPPRTGVFVLPDNASQGTLEDLLLECGDVVYPKQIEAAKAFLGLALPDCAKNEFRDLHLPAGQNKAIIGAVTSLLRPGKSVQVSIQDNKWFSEPGLQLPRLNQVAVFLDELFEFASVQKGLSAGP